MTIDYTVPDSLATARAASAADANRSESDPVIARLVAHIDELVAELRDKTQAHAEAVEAYHAMRRRVRDAVEEDDFR